MRTFWRVLLGTITGFAIVFAAMTPWLFDAKVHWFDTSAKASLRNLASVQEEFRRSGRVDVDGDGVGEYGTFGELTGERGVRIDPEARRQGAKVSPPVLSPALSNVDPAGIVCKSGYAFRILLPGRGGGPVRESGPGAAFTGEVDSDAAERRWSAYAWPIWKSENLRGESRRHYGAFFVDESGDLWLTWNEDRRYCGLNGGPSWDAAMPEDGWGTEWTSPPKGVEEYRGRDGNTWRRVP
jgi:hypothetical protein